MKFQCKLNALRLSLRETADANTFNVRVTAKPADPFQQALTIRPGTILRLERRGAETQFVKVKIFAPRIRYGKMVAGGLLTCEPFS